MSGKRVERDIAEFVQPQQRDLFRDCLLQVPEAALDRISIKSPSVPGLRQGYRIAVTAPDFQGKLKLLLGPGTGRLLIDTCGPVNLDIRMWHESSVTIGRGTTVNQARIVCDDADITVGEDGLWSGDILVQSNDQHGIVDLETMELRNAGRRRITIGEHVWIGRRTIIMPDVEIGKGAILGAGSVLTSDMPPNTIFAGVPARPIRENVSWSRSPKGFSAAERRLMNIPQDPDQPRPARPDDGQNR